MKTRTVLALSFLTALSGALMPGPLLTVTIAQTARDGLPASVLLLTGHSLLELLVVVGLAFGLGTVLKIKPVIGAITVLGGGMLLWMGWGMLPGMQLDLQAAQGAARSGFPGYLILTGAAVSISNPYWVIWWATVGTTLFATLSRPASRMPAQTVGAFYFGHIMGDIVWYLLVAGAVATGRNFIDPKVYSVVVQACGVFLIFLGASFIYLIVSGKLWNIKMSMDWAKKPSGD